MNLTDLILHIPNFLSPEECQVLISAYEDKEDAEWRYEGCSHSLTGKMTQSTFRSVVLSKDHPDAYNLFYTSTETLINKYHQYLDTFDSFHVNFRKALKYSHEMRLMKYYPGSWIHSHTDSSASDPWVWASCSFNLNDDYTGGDFVFFRGKHRLKLSKGDALIWPADYFWTHEVETITSGVRYSANSFLQTLPQEYKLKINSEIKFDHPGAYNIL